MNEIEKKWCADILADLGHSFKGDELLLAEASHRKFYRLYTETNSLVFMVSPPSLENNNQFIKLSKLFLSFDLPVPQILHFEAEQGYFLMDDLGTTRFEDVYGTSTEEYAIKSAISALYEFQKISDPIIPNYTAQRLAEELSIFDNWVIDDCLGGDIPKVMETPASKKLIAQAMEQPQVCIHRDYHCRNLLFENGRLGIVDFQDALIGPGFYDLASLLCDCYHYFSLTKIDQYLSFYLKESNHFREIPFDTAKGWLVMTASQRQIKAIGIFVRLYLRDNKPSHLRYIPQVMEALIQQIEDYPDLESLQELLIAVKNPLTEKIQHYL